MTNYAVAVAMITKNTRPNLVFNIDEDLLSYIILVIVFISLIFNYRYK